MKPVNHLQTTALTYQEICQGERPWVALGNFMNDWFDSTKDRRVQLAADPISLGHQVYIGVCHIGKGPRKASYTF